MPTESKHPETIVLHAGYRSDPATNAVAVPIYQTTSYQFRDTEHASNLFGLKELGNIYTRIMNPTGDVLEQRVAQLEGGVAALALGSGQAASLFCVNNIAQAGDNFVSSTDLDGGNFDWEKHAARFPLLNQPDPAYHGAVWTEAVKPMGPVAYIIKMRVTLLRDLGAAASPFNSFLHIQGLETLPLRMRAHCANATAVSRVLRGHPKVSKVIYPGIMEGEPRRRADAYLKGGYGGLLGLELKGGKDSGQRFIDALQMFYHVANIGDARSLAIHPASTTHSQLTPEEQLQTGVTDGYVRLSLGIEHEDDILADLKQALDAA